MIRYFTIFFFIIIVPLSAKTNNIAVIEIEKLINNNSEYLSILDKMATNQNKYLLEFEESEKKLENMLEEIENSKILLDENEINKLLYEYNNKVKKFTSLVDSFNVHYQVQLTNLRKIILENIIILVENYVKNNNIDIVLDSNNYIIASNTLNITNYIEEKLKNIKLNLRFEDFEKN